MLLPSPGLEAGAFLEVTARIESQRYGYLVAELGVQALNAAVDESRQMSADLFAMSHEERVDFFAQFGADASDPSIGRQIYDLNAIFTDRIASFVGPIRNYRLRNIGATGLSLGTPFTYRSATYLKAKVDADNVTVDKRFTSISHPGAAVTHEGRRVTRRDRLTIADTLDRLRLFADQES